MPSLYAEICFIIGQGDSSSCPLSLTGRFFELCYSILSEEIMHTTHLRQINDSVMVVVPSAIRQQLNL